ncbi:MAG: ATP-binding protein [Peptococcaceae bacterium]|nr:ATP-binding protein [Peptococcaceae bacterium]
MKHFINRQQELWFLNEQYNSTTSSLVILYGRRRMGKTSLIQEFVRDKPFVYFLATEESQLQNMKEFAKQISLLNDQQPFADDISIETGDANWDYLFQTLADRVPNQRLVLVMDGFQYLGKTDPAFPSHFQRIWEKHLQHENIMVILCGSVIHMMDAQTLNVNSPLHGRRTGQLMLRQIDFRYYHELFEGLSYKDLIEHYAVTGGVPSYIEVFSKKTGMPAKSEGRSRSHLLAKIGRHILSKQGFLFEEPFGLLQNETTDPGACFSILKSVAAGNNRISEISADLHIKQSLLPKHIKTLIDLDILELEVPITETNPEKSKLALYQIKDNFLLFWFRFVYPEKARLELGDIAPVLQKIKKNFASNQVASVYKTVCQSEMWLLARQGRLSFTKLGPWWNKNESIDLVALDSLGDEIVFAECRYQTQPMDVDVFEKLLYKKNAVDWKNGSRRERFVLFSLSGFTEQLQDLAAGHDDIILFRTPQETV